MKFFKFFLVISITSLSLGYFGYSLYKYNENPCSDTIEYSIGRFDMEFGISKEEFKKYLEESHEVWNKATGKQTFVYNEEADFKVNLIFDQRQLDTIQKQKTEFGLSQVEDKLKQLDIRLNNANINYSNKIDVYQTRLKSLENRQNEYEREVNYWNSRGGAPEAEFRKLESERIILSNLSRDLNQEASEINNMVPEINNLLKIRNEAAKEYNRVAELYNQKYGKGLEFNQAEYNGREINIYQFSGREDLMVAMIHEFGHALGLDHVDEPSALMYYLTGGNNEVRLELTEADLEEMRRVCKL